MLKMEDIIFIQLEDKESKTGLYKKNLTLILKTI